MNFTKIVALTPDAAKAAIEILVDDGCGFTHRYSDGARTIELDEPLEEMNFKDDFDDMVDELEGAGIWQDLIFKNAD